MEERINMAVPAAIMLNILGGTTPTSHNAIIDAALLKPNAALHMYGKEPKPGRKIGHITIIEDTMDRAEQQMSSLITLVDTLRTERKSPPNQPYRHRPPPPSQNLQEEPSLSSP
jgi:phosphoribosylaminoimidazole carboxylase